MRECTRMNVRYRNALTVTSLALTLGLAPPPPAPHPTCIPLAALYSPRALRQIRRILQLELIRSRAAQLQLARAAVLGTLPAGALVSAPTASQLLTQDITRTKLKHLPRAGTIQCW